LKLTKKWLIFNTLVNCELRVTHRG